METHKTNPRHPLDDVIPEAARQHMRAAREEMKQSWETLLPPGFVEHRRAARREMLLAARSLIEAALRRLDERQPPRPPETTQL